VCALCCHSFLQSNFCLRQVNNELIERSGPALIHACVRRIKGFSAPPLSDSRPTTGR
jgi:hypothetical protein